MTTLPNGNRKIAASGSVELWEVTLDYYNSFNAKPVHEVYDKGRSLPPGTTKVWFLAASMGWIENQGTSGQYKLSVTMLGHMILGILDNGKPLSYTPTF